MWLDEHHLKMEIEHRHAQCRSDVAQQRLSARVRAGRSDATDAGSGRITGPVSTLGRLMPGRLWNALAGRRA
jgi:hypothetical protein